MTTLVAGLLACLASFILGLFCAWEIFPFVVARLLWTTTPQELADWQKENPLGMKS